jgi:hypothetical protein
MTLQVVFFKKRRLNVSSFLKKRRLDVSSFCRGQPRGSPKNRGGILLKTSKKRKTQNAKHTSNLTQNVHAQHSTCRGGPHGPPEWPNKAPPRARSVSLEGSRSLERAPPRSWVPASLERAPPRSRFPHEHTCSRTHVRAFNALTRQSRAITRLGITPRRCSANSLGGAHPRHCRELCDEAGVSSMTLCRPLLYG